MPLPLLPGYNIQTTIPTSFRKNHQFDVQNNIRVTDAVELRALDGPVQRSEELPRAVIGSVGYPVDAWAKKIPLRDRNAIPMSKLPPWIAFDNKVLKFMAYYKDAVHESPLETERVHSCDILYYLEDDSIHVEEIKDDNSGMKQGLLIRRHQIPRCPEAYYVLHDFAIGAELTMYGKTFKVMDADPYTRNYFRDSLNILLPPGLPIPVDIFHTKHNVIVRGSASDNRKQASAVTKFVEAHQGKALPFQLHRTRQYLMHDRQVLRFYATWRDPTLFNEPRPFIVHFFRADSSMEVLEVKQPNSGRDAFPALLKRQRMPKYVWGSNQARIGTDESDNIEFYKEADFKVGTPILVYGRELQLTGMDRYTSNFYKTEFGLSGEQLLPTVDAHHDVPVPDTECDHQPEAQQRQSFEEQPINKSDSMQLRFEAIINSKSPEDRDRKFVVSFFVGDGTVAIFENVVRNSGFVGGKFLDRAHIADTNLTDFYVGCALKINRFSFKLTNADQFTLRYMEAHPTTFPFSDVDLVESKLRSLFLSPAVQQQFDDETANKDYHLGQIALGEWIRSIGGQLNDQELLTLFRKYSDDQGSIRLLTLFERVKNGAIFA